MADKAEDLVQYIAEKVSHYIDTPKEERKQLRSQRSPKQDWLSRWFGVVPFALSMWFDQNKKKLKRR